MYIIQFLKKAFKTNKTFVIHFSNQYLKLYPSSILDIKNYIIKSAKLKNLNIILPYLVWKDHRNLNKKIINLDEYNRNNSLLMELLRRDRFFFSNNDFYLRVGIISKNKNFKKKFELKNNQNIFETQSLYNIFKKSTIIGLGVSTNYCYPFHYLQYQKFGKKFFKKEIARKVIYKDKLYVQKKKILKIKFTKDKPSKFIDFNLKKNVFKKNKNKFFFYYNFSSMVRLYKNKILTKFSKKNIN